MRISSLSFWPGAVSICPYLLICMCIPKVITRQSLLLGFFIQISAMSTRSLCLQTHYALYIHPFPGHNNIEAPPARSCREWLTESLSLPS